ncbi:hypothetical protein [Paraburkholderia ferrariae]|uniref:hypothetical protein n=1 Tax=Paraburkholderia ferrariae TaxID=386056 RepID=UPI000483B26F|nr:hypothetical protein [Paraburkholderia ferrariae]
MNFGLLLPHLPQTQDTQHRQHPIHPDALAARQRAPAAPPCRRSALAARWHSLRARLFRV